MREEKPTDDTANDVARGERDVHVKGLELGKPSGLKENNGVSQNSVTAEDLRSPDHTVLRD